MKTGLNPENIMPILKGISENEGWVLCIGAGISLPVIPDWNSLVKELIYEIESNPDYIYEEIIKSYNPDSIIQSAFNILGESSEKFSERLSKIIYKNIKNEIAEKEWKNFIKILNTRNPSKYDSKSWYRFLDIIESLFKKTTLYQIAKIIVKNINTNLLPKAILSFNADPILYTTIHALLRRKLTIEGNVRKNGNGMKKYLDIVNGSLSLRNVDRIPYYFIHGLLPIPGISHKNSISSFDKLVFSEDSYLKIADSQFSWQSASFINSALSHRIVFIGISLSDPNMRRWLSQVHKNRIKEINSLNVEDPTSTKHYWINKKSKSNNCDKWLESIVSHLGVRLIWINEWADVENVFNKLLKK